MLRSLPVGDPSRLYRIGDGDSCCVQGGPQDRWGMFSFPLFERLKAELPEFEELTAFQAGGARFSVRRQGVDAAAMPLRAEFVTGNYFSTLGVSAFGGRVFTAADDTPSAAPAAVLSHHIWQATYGGDPGVVGATFIMIAALKTSRIAAALLNPPYNFLAYREGLNNLGFSGNFVRLPSTGVATLGETLERAPEQVRRLIRALTRARAFAKDNKAKVLPTLKRAMRIDDEDLLSKIYDQHKQVETADGKVDATLIADTIRDARQTENIAKEIPANQVFDFSYLPAR